MISQNDFYAAGQEAVTKAVQEVQTANKVVISKEGLLVLTTFGKKIVDTLWEELQKKGN